MTIQELHPSGKHIGQTCEEAGYFLPLALLATIQFLMFNTSGRKLELRSRWQDFVPI
jgi:hypothetical protein